MNKEIKKTTKKRNVTRVNYLNRITQNGNVTVSTLTFGINIDKIAGFNAVLATAGGDFDVLSRRIADKFQEFEGFYDAFGFVCATFTVTGISRCNTGDTYNSTVGNRLATTDAETKSFAIARRFYEYCAKVLLNNVAEFEELADNCDKTVADCSKHSEYLITNTNINK